MKLRRIALMSILAAGLSACGSADLASRNISPEAATVIDGSQYTAKAAMYNVQDLRVNVPRTLVVSEANLFYPGGDIVWRAEPYGDRYAQVQAIFTEGLGRGAARLKSGPEVIVDVEVVRFHSLSEKARYTTGGVHNMIFNMAILDAETGAVIQPAQEYKIDLDAFGGRRAFRAERQGQTQRVRVTDRLAHFMIDTLSAPVSGPLAEAAVARRANGI